MDEIEDGTGPVPDLEEGKDPEAAPPAAPGGKVPTAGETPVPDEEDA